MPTYLIISEAKDSNMQLMSFSLPASPLLHYFLSFPVLESLADAISRGGKNALSIRGCNGVLKAKVNIHLCNVTAFVPLCEAKVKCR